MAMGFMPACISMTLGPVKHEKEAPIGQMLHVFRI